MNNHNSEEVICPDKVKVVKDIPPPPKMPIPSPKRVISSWGGEIKPRTSCKWWQRHDWGKWAIDRVMVGDLNYPVVIQSRECKYCGKIELRRERSFK